MVLGEDILNVTLVLNSTQQSLQAANESLQVRLI